MKKRKAIAALLAVMMLLSATPAMSASAAALTCPGTGGWSSMKYDDATGNTTWYMKDGSVIVQDANGNVIQNTQTSAPSAEATGWTSDTNSDLTVQPGKTYQFKFTAANPSGINVWMGTPGVFNITKSGQESGAVYYKITAVGTPGAAAGVYVSYNGSSGTKLCVATVAGGSTSSGSTSSGSTSTPSTPSSGGTTSGSTTGLTEQQQDAIDAGLTLGDYCHEYEQEVFELVNQEREKAGLPTLVWAKSLTEDAQIRAKELETLYSHDRPNGGAAYWENIATGGYRQYFWDENNQLTWKRAMGYPEDVVQAWMNSSGHRANILHENAVAMAVGCYVAEDGTLYWVQCFTNNELDLSDPITTTPLL